MGEVEIVDGRYSMWTALMVRAPVDDVRALLADQTRLVEWVPLSYPAPGPVGEGEVRLTVGDHGGADHLGSTTVEADGTVVRRWSLLGEPRVRGVPTEPRWHREVRYGTRFVEGGTHLDVEVVTTVVGASVRNLGGAASEARALDRALANLARVAEGARRRRRRGGRAAGPL